MGVERRGPTRRGASCSAVLSLDAGSAPTRATSTPSGRLRNQPPPVPIRAEISGTPWESDFDWELRGELAVGGSSPYFSIRSGAEHGSWSAPPPHWFPASSSPRTRSALVDDLPLALLDLPAVELPGDLVSRPAGIRHPARPLLDLRHGLRVHILLRQALRLRGGRRRCHARQLDSRRRPPRAPAACALGLGRHGASRATARWRSWRGDSRSWGKLLGGAARTFCHAVRCTPLWLYRRGAWPDQTLGNAHYGYPHLWWRRHRVLMRWPPSCWMCPTGGAE